MHNFITKGYSGLSMNEKVDAFVMMLMIMMIISVLLIHQFVCSELHVFWRCIKQSFIITLSVCLELCYKFPWNNLKLYSFQLNVDDDYDTNVPVCFVCYISLAFVGEKHSTPLVHELLMQLKLLLTSTSYLNYIHATFVKRCSSCNNVEIAGRSYN